MLNDGRKWPWTVQLLFKMNIDYDKTRLGEDALGMTEYALRLTLSMRTKEHLYNDSTRSAKERCITMEFGQINEMAEGKFYPWPTHMLFTTAPDVTRVYKLDAELSEDDMKAMKEIRGSKFVEMCCVKTSDEALAEKLFNARVWPRYDNPMDDSQFLPPRTDSGGDLRYVIGVQNDAQCYQVIKKVQDVDTPTWVKIANFHVVDYLAIFAFLDKSNMPFHRFLVRQLVDADGVGTYYHAAGKKEPEAHELRRCQYLDVEVDIVIANLRAPCDLQGAFQKANSSLNAFGMDLAMWGCVVEGLEMPRTTTVITNFGRQEGSDLFVAGNCCFSKGKYLRLDEAGVAIIPSYFMEFSNVPLPPIEYPRFLVIPYPAIRYFIYIRTYAELMPLFFKNNLMQARAVFAMAVIGMHADKLWSGQHGLGRGMPFTWIYSPEPGTGKTESALLAQGLIGCFGRNLWAGDSTRAALMERLSAQRDLSLIVDDVCINSKENSSKSFSDLGRTLFERSIRVVSKKVRQPLSSCMFTSNQTVNDKDVAFNSRMILLKFHKLEDDGSADSPELFQQWMQFRELMSACALDLESLLWNGKLDKQAMQDCATYLQGVVGKKRDRNVNCWGVLLYYMLNLNFLAQCHAGENEVLFDWIIRRVTLTAYEQNNHSSLIDQFVLGVSKIRADCGTMGIANPLGPVDKTIYWDKLRTDQKPPEFQMMQNKDFIAVRVEACIAVLESVLGLRINVDQLWEEVDRYDYAFKGRAYFADASKQWPLDKQVEDVIGFRKVPLQEHEVAGIQTRSRCVYFLKTNWDSIVQSVEVGARIDVDYKNYEIKSTIDGQPYKLWQVACGHAEDGWFGFRATGQSNYSTFCGAFNELNIGSATTHLTFDSAVAEETRKAGFGDIAHMFHPTRILEFFDYDFHDADHHPPCYKQIAWTSRDADDDRPHADPLSFCLNIPPSPDSDGFGTPPRNGPLTPISSDGGSPLLSPSKGPQGCDDSLQTDWNGGSPPAGGYPGSKPLGDITNERFKTFSGPSDVQPKVRRARPPSRANRFIESEAEASDDDETEAGVC